MTFGQTLYDIWTNFINDPKYKKYFSKEGTKENIKSEKKEIIIITPSEEKQSIVTTIHVNT